MKKQFTLLLILSLILGLTPINFSQAITKNQIDAEVQIVCTDGEDNWFSGSGTIIDPKGIILTNRHVIEGAYMNICFIGFIESIGQEPNFGTDENPYLAEVKYYSATDDMDVAILYLDNPTNKVYPYVDIWNSNSNLLQFGDKIETIGFPGIGGSTITYTSGDFSGFGSNSDGTQNYIKTTAQLEHGNSGGAAYNSNGQFIGIPTMVIVGELNSMNYVLSVNSVKNWLSDILGHNYQQETIEQKTAIEKLDISIQEDITPPTQREFEISFYALDKDNKEIYRGYRYGDNTSAIYEYSRIRFAWNANCADNSGNCINDNDSFVKEYYYYFGNNPNAIPKKDGKHIMSNELTIPNRNMALVKLPEVFELEGGEKKYFILQAVDDSGNISNPLINLEYIYEPDKFKDIENININDFEDNLIGSLDYPTNDEMPVCNNNTMCKGKVELGYVINTIYTNQDTLYLYPQYGYNIDGLVYYVSYDNDRFWHDELRKGVSTSDNFIKVTDIKKENEINVFIKPFSATPNAFMGKHHVLTIYYNEKMQNKIKAFSRKDKYDTDNFYTEDITKNWVPLLFQELDNNLMNRLKGLILLQTEANGEAYYVYPGNNNRYYLGRPDDAFNIMRKLGLGATHDFITGHTIYPDNVLGKILIDVEQNGEAYYIYPKDKKSYYLGRPTDAFSVMRNLGLGITNDDLNKINIDETN